MEKVGVLIGRLQEQFSQQAKESSLLNTALLLVTELQSNQAAETIGGKVSIIMPYKPFEVIADNDNDIKESTDNAVDESPDNMFEESTDNIVEENETTETIDEPEVPEEENIEEISAPYAPEPEPMQTSPINTLAEEKYTELMDETPTLVQQQPKVVYELNDTVQGEPSINDKLKTQVPETGRSLQNEPIKDLRKAIGINDKYAFMRDLFRNDEAAYERSIKTINSFNILPEAEYWIQREMKYKLGWDDNSPTVQAFYQLVKRRFS